MNYIGKGIYPIPVASRLTGVSTGRIRRWISGYSPIVNGIRTARPGLFTPDFKVSEQFKSISFLDLVEIVFIDAFSKHGFSLQQIRAAAERAAKVFDTDHPFAMRRLYTDTRTIFLRVLEEENTADLIDLQKRQYQLDSIVLPHLLECIDFNQFDVAARWWPNGRNGGIVVDPDLSFGKPVVDGFGVPTSLIYRMNKKGRSVVEISEWYSLPVESVKLAIEFETTNVA